MKAKDYLPGQPCVLHWFVKVSVVSRELPSDKDKTHVKPPFAGEGLLHNLVADEVPLLQVFVQVLFVHCPQPP